MINKRKIGSEQEQAALQFLVEQGMKIKEVNYYTPIGEIDIIGQIDDYLVFIEVKFRSSIKVGFAEEAITKQKQRRICKVADWYKMKGEIYDDVPIRYDVICLYPKEIRWYKNAFEHHT